MVGIVERNGIPILGLDVWFVMTFAPLVCFFSETDYFMMTSFSGNMLTISSTKTSELNTSMHSGTLLTGTSEYKFFTFDLVSILWRIFFVFCFRVVANYNAASVQGIKPTL